MLTRLWLPIQNGDTQLIPPHAAVQANGDITSDGVMIVTRPVSENTGNIFINGHGAVAVDGRGSASQSFPLTVAFHDDVDGLLPTSGDIWGPRIGSWFFHRAQAGFTAIGNAGTKSQFANFTRHHGVESPLRCQLTTSLSPCSSATAIAMLWNSSAQDWCDEGDELTVYDSASIVKTELDPGVWLWVTFQPDSQLWEVLDVGDFGCCGGSGSGSGNDCVTLIGGIDPEKLPMVDPDGGTVYGLVWQDGCLRRIETGDCDE